VGWGVWVRWANERGERAGGWGGFGRGVSADHPLPSFSDPARLLDVSQYVFSCGMGLFAGEHIYSCNGQMRGRRIVTIAVRGGMRG
jgi:hypothetical protein